MENQKLSPYAMFLVSAMMMQETLDQMPSQPSYKHKLKQLGTNMQAALTPIIEKHFKGMNAEAQEGLNTIWNVCEFIAQFCLSMDLVDLERMKYVMEKIKQTDAVELSGLLALIESFFQGEVYQAKTPELIEKFIEQKRVTKIGAKDAA